MDQGKLFIFNEEPEFPTELQRYRIEKEDQFFDRKRARIDVSDTDRPIGAFANANGGCLVIGIANDGTITGFKEEGAHAREDFEKAPIMCCTPVPKFTTRIIDVVNTRGEQDQVLIIEIEPSIDRVVRSVKDGAVYLRVGDESKKLTHEQITALEYDKNERAFEDQVIAGATIDCVDIDVAEHYMKLRKATGSVESVLETRRFLRNGELTTAGVLLFSKSPASFLPTARVRFNRFDGNKMETGKRLNIVKSLEFDEPIPRLLEEAQVAISGQLREFQYLDDDGKFKTIPEYPEFAWFEGLVNAVTHRDYSFLGDTIRIAMYDDRLEILSPGKLPNIVTLENTKHQRYSRNPKIAQTLHDFGWVKELNEGVNRIYDEMQSFFLNDPVYTEPEGRFVMLVLENSVTSRTLRGQDGLRTRLDEELLESLNDMSLLRFSTHIKKGK